MLGPVVKWISALRVQVLCVVLEAQRAEELVQGEVSAWMRWIRGGLGLKVLMLVSVNGSLTS